MRRDLTDLDYFRTDDDVICLVKGYYHPENIVLAIPVFWPDPQGERIHISGKRYRKEVKEVIRSQEIPKAALRIPLDKIVEVYKPRKSFEEFLREPEDSVWRQIALAFHEIGKVPRDDIGIFGSYLVGLAKKQEGELIKDVDFLIYGLDNFCRLRNGGFQKIQEKLGFNSISQDHINRQAQKYGQYFDQGFINFQETLKRKWPTLQIAPGLLSTVRFVYKKNEIPPNPITSAPLRRIKIRGEVKKAEGINFMPRVFEVSSSSQVFHIATYFWAFYCAVREGDKVEIAGTLHEDDSLISLDDPSSGIKIIN